MGGLYYIIILYRIICVCNMTDNPIQYGRIRSAEELGDLIRRHRKGHGLSLKTASGLAGPGIRFLSEFERGKETAEIGKILKTLEALGLHVIIRPGNYRSSRDIQDVLPDSRGSYPAVNSDDISLPGGLAPVPRYVLAELARRYHIKRLALFGSAARGELTPSSDIDLLVEFEQGKAPSLGGMTVINNAFSPLFGGRKVDIATPAILNNPYRRREIEKDLELLYAA